MVLSPMPSNAHKTTVRDSRLVPEEGLSKNETAVIVFAICMAIAIIAAVYIALR